MELDLLEDQRLKEKTAERFLKSSLGSINKEAMVLRRDDEDTGIKSKYDGMSESEIIEAKKKVDTAEPETVEKQQESLQLDLKQMKLSKLSLQQELRELKK